MTAFRSLSAALVLVLSCPSIGSAAAQGSNTLTLEAKKTVLALLQKSTVHYATLGYVPVDEDLVDMNALEEGESDAELVYSLKGRATYVIHGVCDGDCDDLDINVYDEKGKLLASDTDEDDTPALELKAASDTDFTVEVVMASCTNGPCFYGVDLLQKH